MFSVFVNVTVDCDSFHTQSRGRWNLGWLEEWSILFAGIDNSACDFSSVGNKYLFEHARIVYLNDRNVNF